MPRGKKNKMFSENFRATKKQINPELVDFNILGLHKKEYFDSFGDLIKIELYQTYDEPSETHIDLAVVEDRIYTRSATTGLITKREITITWYYENGEVGSVVESRCKYYSAKKGFRANKRARKNIIDQASMYLFQQLMSNDPTTADVNVDDFESLTDSAASKYIKSNMQPLLTIITNSTDNTKPEYRTYITEAMRDVLLTILTISYK